MRNDLAMHTEKHAMTMSVAALETKIAKLEASVAAHTQAALAHAVEKARLEAERDHYKQLFELTHEEKELLKRKIFGPKRERVPEEQLKLAFAEYRKVLAAGVGTLAENDQQNQEGDGEDKPKDGPKKNRGPKNPTPHGRRKLADMDLPVERIVLPVTVPEDARLVTEELVSCRLEYQRARLVRLEVIRPIYAVDKEDEQDVKVVFVAPEPPAELIPRGLAGPGLLAEVVHNRFCDHLPYNRQEQRFEREGATIDRATMSRWAKAAHDSARRIVDAMRQEAIATADVLYTDATGVLVQHPVTCRKGHFFVVLADHDHVFFTYTPKEDSAFVKKLFAGYRGYLQADAKSIYDALYRDGAVQEVGCYAHARRKFHEAMGQDKERALIGVGYINALFELERAWAGLPASERLKRRKAESQAVVDALFRWAKSVLAHNDRTRGLLQTAVGYLLRQEQALRRFMDDGKLRLDNNRSELALRSLVVGRKNWLFVGSDEYADVACTFISLIASCKLHGVDTLAYLRDIFRVLPYWPQTRVIELAPKYWTETRKLLDPTELARPLGDITVPPRRTANHAAA